MALLCSHGVYHGTTVHVVTPDEALAVSVSARSLKQALGSMRLASGVAGRKNNAPTEGRLLEALGRLWRDAAEGHWRRWQPAASGEVATPDGAPEASEASAAPEATHWRRAEEALLAPYEARCGAGAVLRAEAAPPGSGPGLPVVEEAEGIPDKSD